MGAKKLSKVSVTTFIAIAGLATFSHADNPISTYHYLADPAATADDEYFYIITDSDDPAAHNADGYNIKSLYAFRSKDMQNWSDLGIIFKADREYPFSRNGWETHGVENIWASGIDIKNGKFYIIYPDGASSVGFIKADNINGPYVNAISGHEKLVGGNGQVGCGDIAWCFDPSIFVDDDGTAWMTYGGGENNSRPNTDNFNMYKMNDNMDGVVTSTLQHVKVNNLPKRKMLEASYIHKYNGKYYFSYSTGWQDGAPTIDYGMSDKVTGPYTWKGTILGDPSIGGKSINGNNNHHGIAEFKGHSYVVYHDRRIANGYNGLERIPADDGIVTSNTPNGGYHRSVSIDEMFYNTDGTIKTVEVTNGGPTQIEEFDPYDVYPALTSSKQKGVRSRTDWNKSDWERGIPATHVLTPQASREESWIRVSGVDFGKGAKTFRITGASVANDNKVEIRTGSAKGTLAGTCNIQKTNGWQDYADNECDVTGLSGKVDQLFIVFKGSKDSTMGLIEWEFIGEGGKTPDTPQQPFGGTAAVIPGKIEAENFDVPGVGRGSDLKSYYDSDSEDHGAESNGGTSFREGTGVDIYKKATGYIVGYNADGEWLEYTVDVKEAGDYTIFASVATDNNTSGFTLSLDGTVIAEFGEFNGSSFDIYDTVQANVNIATTGQHILRMDVTSPWFDVDFFAFVKGENATSTEIKDVPTNTVSSDSIKAGDNSSVKPGTEPAALYRGLALETNTHTSYTVFDLRGNKVASFTVTNGSMASVKANVANLVKQSGFYIIKPVRGGATMRIAVTK